MIVKIDRSSIVKNPNAGSTQTSIACYRETSFEYNGTLEGLEELSKLDTICLRSSSIVNLEEEMPNVTAEGIINVYDENTFPKIEGLTITYRVERQQVNHFPEPKWIYKYTDPEVVCIDCGVGVKISEIEISESSYYESDIDYMVFDPTTRCPKCYSYDSFEEIKYEEIEDIRES